MQLRERYKPSPGVRGRASARTSIPFASRRNRRQVAGGSSAVSLSDHRVPDTLLLFGLRLLREPRLARLEVVHCGCQRGTQTARRRIRGKFFEGGDGDTLGRGAEATHGFLVALLIRLIDLLRVP